MQLMNFKEWIEGLPGNPLVTQAAENAGIDRSTISRQLKRGSVSAENVIALARAHGANEIDALIETGYVDADALATAGIPQALGYATNEQILEEIRRRVDPEAIRLLRGGTGDVITPRRGRPVTGGDIITPSFGRPAMSDLPDNVAAHHGEKGVPDIVSEAEESQVDPNEDGFDPA